MLLERHRSPLLSRLIEALCCLPGVGPKSAQRMAYHLLRPSERSRSTDLARALLESIERLRLCARCRYFCESEHCNLCQHPSRDADLLCVVEQPVDLELIERTGHYQGHYFVLHGRLSPLDGITPQELGLEHLFHRLSEGTLRELIVATNATPEGEATAYYIAEHARDAHVQITRLAHGIPMGGSLEYVDALTLGRALDAREVLS